MLIKIENSKKTGSGPIKVLYPGLFMPNSDDTGIGTIGRIDHANIQHAALIAMHPHVNDEILSYFRSGKVKHTDSVGFTEFITPERLMLMKAGRSFFHEEKVLEESGAVEGLQIFIRPSEHDLEPLVTFHEWDEVYSPNKWRLIAAPAEDNAPQTLRSKTWIYDRQVTTNGVFELPKFDKTYTTILYMYQGEAKIGNLNLLKGDALIIKDEEALSVESTASELVFFVTDEQSKIYKSGMFSGNQYK